MKIRVSNFLSIVVLTAVLLSLLRLGLYLLHPDDFASLTIADVIGAFLMGLRIDAASIVWVTMLPALLLFLPLEFMKRRGIRLGIYALFFMGINLLVMTVFGDAVYFNHVHRHAGNEVMILGNDFQILIDTVLAHWEWFLGFFLFEVFLLAFFYLRINVRDESKEGSFNKTNVGVFLLIVVLMVVVGRGKLTGKTMGVTDAFASSKVASGNLALNGFFSIARSRKATKVSLALTPEEAKANVTQVLMSSETQFQDNDYPLLRSYISDDRALPDKPNVVIVLLESWSGQYIDGFSENHLGLTPNFEALAKDGIRYTNFYANGQRSIEGVTAMLTGIPSLPYSNVLGHGLELSNRTYLGGLAKANGYSTLAMQSSNRSSFRLDSIAKIAGFDEYYGAEDIPHLGWETGDKAPSFGVWDNDMLNFYLSKISELKPPFLTFAFTASTHSTFVSPGAQWEVFPHEEETLPGFFNTLKYADEALGRFMDEARKQPWFDNTVFIFMADHTLGFSDNRHLKKNGIKLVAQRELEKQRIPLLIYAPKLIKPSESKRLGSQADLMPTVVHLLGWTNKFSSTSHSLLDETAAPFVLYANGSILGYVTENGYLEHNLKNVLESTLSKKDEETALSFYSLIQDLQEKNTIVPPSF